jgi:hypothetical protein
MADTADSHDWVVGCAIKVLTKHTKEVSSSATAAPTAVWPTTVSCIVLQLLRGGEASQKPVGSKLHSADKQCCSEDLANLLAVGVELSQQSLAGHRPHALPGHQ